MRFCTFCMTAHGLDPANSRLALPGCKPNRMAMCDGMAHNRTIMVNELGEAVDVAKAAGEVVKAAESKQARAGHSLMR